MPLLLSDPSDAVIRRYLDQQGNAEFSYRDVGRTKESISCPGFTVDDHRRQIGVGEACFQKACEFIRNGDQLRLGWVTPFFSETPLREGQTIVLLIRGFGLRVLTSCRVVYLLQESGEMCRGGFAYGTLDDHPECGEERFQIVWDRQSDGVWYEIAAFSRPSLWYSKIGYPLVRRMQYQFAADSTKAVTDYVTTAAIQSSG